MVVQTKHRFSVKEYYRMAETGVLRPDARVELLNGEIIDMSPIGPFHGGVTNYLNQFFTARQRPLDHVRSKPGAAGRPFRAAAGLDAAQARAGLLSPAAIRSRKMFFC